MKRRSLADVDSADAAPEWRAALDLFRQAYGEDADLTDATDATMCFQFLRIVIREQVEARLTAELDARLEAGTARLARLL